MSYYYAAVAYPTSSSSSHYRSSSSTQQQPTTYRMALNEYLQQLRRQNEVSWSESCEGRRERPHWTVTCRISNVEYGSGRALTKARAKELAAKEALEALQRQATYAAQWQTACSTYPTTSNYPTTYYYQAQQYPTSYYQYYTR